MKYELGELVGMTSSTRFVKIIARDICEGVNLYWCRLSPGNKYFTMREEDLRKLQ